MSFHEVLTRVISGLLSFPMFLVWLVGLSFAIDRIEDFAGSQLMNRSVFQVAVITLSGVLAVAMIWRILRWLEPQHWQGEGLGLWILRFFADGAIGAVAAFALFYPVQQLYIAFIDPGAFSGFLGGLDALLVVPIEAALCLAAAIVLIVLRKRGALGASNHRPS